jgi:hypothetical protein
MWLSLDGRVSEFHRKPIGEFLQKTHELRNEVSSVDLMSLPNLLPQRSQGGILPAGGLFAIKQGESYDASFLQ